MNKRALIPLGIVLCVVVLLPACDSSSPLASSVLDGSSSTPDELTDPTWQFTVLPTPGGTRETLYLRVLGAAEACAVERGIGSVLGTTARAS